jgi:hypothetical protein
VEPLGHYAIRFLHRGDLREHVGFQVRLFVVRARAAAGFRPSSRTRSFIAARSSSVNPLKSLVIAVVLPAACWVSGLI